MSLHNQLRLWFLGVPNLDDQEDHNHNTELGAWRGPAKAGCGQPSQRQQGHQSCKVTKSLPQTLLQIGSWESGLAGVNDCLTWLDVMRTKRYLEMCFMCVYTCCCYCDACVIVFCVNLINNVKYFVISVVTSNTR